MKARVIIVFILLVVLAGDFGCAPDHQGSKKIYLSADGNDESSGSQSHPWKTIARLNKADLGPGDSVFFMGGSSFRGSIVLDSTDSGNEELAVVLGSFGNGRATIESDANLGIAINGCRFIVLNKLIVKGSGRKEGNETDGIMIESSGHIAVSSVDVSGFQHSGIHIYKGSGIILNDVDAHDNGFAGINVSGNTAYDTVNYDNEDIYIGHCQAWNNPGDPSVKANHSGNGILVSSARRGKIEYCEAYNNGWDMPWTGNGPVGIWLWDCSGINIQYCTSHDNKTNPVAKDGGGFDLDGGVSDCVIQYCLSYNNMGAGYGLYEFGAGKFWKDNTVRYNISYNDGYKNAGSVGIWKSSPSTPMGSCSVYNNTFYNTDARGISMMIDNNNSGISFRNNIFVYSTSFLEPGQKFESEIFEANCIWKKGKKDSGPRPPGIYLDPLLKSPESFKAEEHFIMSEATLEPFYLTSHSPLIDKGVDLKTIHGIDCGEHDICGTMLPQNSVFDIGAVEYKTNPEPK